MEKLERITSYICHTKSLKLATIVFHIYRECGCVYSRASHTRSNAAETQSEVNKVARKDLHWGRYKKSTKKKSLESSTMYERLFAGKVVCFGHQHTLAEGHK